MKTLNRLLQAGPPSLHTYCAVVLHSCITLPPVDRSSNHQYHCRQLQENRAVFRIFMALLRFFNLTLPRIRNLQMTDLPNEIET